LNPDASPGGGKSPRGKKRRMESPPPVPPSFFDSRPALTGRLAAENLLRREPIRRMLQQQGEKGLDAVVDFLAELCLFMHIPSSHLIPHPDLLPLESVRFFHIDANWLDAALEGALSIGVESSKDLAYQKLMKDSIRAAVAKATKQKRQALAGTDDGLLRA